MDWLFQQVKRIPLTGRVMLGVMAGLAGLYVLACIVGLLLLSSVQFG